MMIESIDAVDWLESAVAYNAKNARKHDWIGRVVSLKNGVLMIAGKKGMVAFNPSIHASETSEPAIFAKAVKDWQSKNGLEADGKLGPKTWAKMTGQPAPKAAPKPSPKPTPKPEPKPDGGGAGEREPEPKKDGNWAKNNKLAIGGISVVAIAIATYVATR